MHGRFGIWIAGLLVLSCVSLQPLGAQSEQEIARYADEGQRALANGDYSKAEQAFEKLRRLRPEVAEVHANLGVIYYQEKKYDQAVQALRLALKLKPALQRSATLLAISLSELGRFPEAVPGLEKGFHQSADKDTKRMCGLELLRAYTGLQQDSQAVAVALEMNRLYPDDPEVLYHTGKVFGNSAFLSMQRLSQVAPGSVWQHQTLAEAYESQKSYDAAIGEYRQVLAIDPRRPGIHYRIGRTLLSRALDTASSEDRSAAGKEFEQELAADPLDANSAYELAELHRSAGEFEQARRYFEQALDSYPRFEEAHLGMAAVLMSLQKPDLALPHLEKAIALNRDNEVSWYRYSQVEGMLGNLAERQKAMAEFQRLHSAKRQQQEAEKKLFTQPEEVTEQKIDADSSK